MKHLILCEGKTDAILLSYYLQATNQWVFTKKQPKDLTIQVDDINGESLNWYQRGEDSLLICGVGGKDKFHKFFREKIQDPQVKSDAFSKIAVIMDRDQDSESDLLRKVDRDFYPLIQKPLLNKWCPCSYRNGYGEEKSFSFLLIVIPTDKEGAMEALILDAICEDQENKIIVDLCRDHVDHVQPFAWRYISKN